MPTTAEIRQNARDDEALTRLAEWHKKSGTEDEPGVTLTTYLLARLIVAVEQVEAKLDR